MSLVVALHFSLALCFQALVAEGRGGLISAPSKLCNPITVSVVALEALFSVVALEALFSVVTEELGQFW